MNARRTRTTALVALVLAGSTLLAACGQGSDDEAGSSTPSASAATANSADVEFTQMMIVHHQGALDMAALAADRAGSQDVKDLAARIEAPSSPEIDTMASWLESWGEEPLDAGGAMPGMDHGAMSADGEGGMASQDDMTNLGDATGSDFDRLFLTLMVAHHEGAVAMAQTEVDHGQAPDAVGLAKKVITDQSAEIDEMKTLLTSFSGD